MRAIALIEGSGTEAFSEERRVRIEKRYGIQMESDFVAMSRLCNGGIPVLRCFDVDGRERMIERFLCLLDAPDASRVGHHGMYDIGVTRTMINDRLRDWLIPFAVLFAGDMLCFQYKADYDPESDPDDDLDDDNRILDPLAIPMICVWDHEQSRELRPVLHPVSNSFAQFIDLLKEPRK